jgi:hypothetical protein
VLSIWKLGYTPFISERIIEEEASASFGHPSIVLGTQPLDLWPDCFAGMMVAIAHSNLNDAVGYGNDEAESTPGMEKRIRDELAGQ